MEIAQYPAPDIRPDHDFWPDMAEINLEPIKVEILNLMRTSVGREIVTTEEDWSWLRYWLAEYLAQERFRARMPSSLELRLLVSLQHAAARMVGTFDALVTRGGLRHLPWEYLQEHTVVRAGLDVLARSGLVELEYPPPAPLLDHRLRYIWEQLTGKKASVRKDGLGTSDYCVFVRLVLGALPANECPADMVSTLAERPKQYMRQMDKRARDWRKTQQQIERLWSKITLLG